MDNTEVLNAIADLKSEMTGLKSDMTGLKSEMTDLKSDMTGLKSEMTDLKSDMNSNFRSVKKRLDGIEHELKKINTVIGYSDQYKNIPN